MRGTTFIAGRSVLLACSLIGLGWYQHITDVKVHKAVDADPISAQATVKSVNNSWLGGVYLIVDFTDDQQRPDETHVWYGWTTTKFHPGEQVAVEYDEADPLRAYVVTRSVADNLKVLEYASPVILALSLGVAASMAKLSSWRRSRRRVSIF